MAEKTGWLTKCGGFWKTWHQRWFTLIGTELEYTKRPGVPPQGVIDLTQATLISMAPESKRQPAFQIVTPERTYYIVGETEAECQEWIEVLNKNKDSQGVTSCEGSEDNYKVIKLIGHGLRSNSFAVRKITDDSMLCMKRYEIRNIGMQTELIAKYKAAFNGAEKPFITKMEDAFETDKAVFLIFEKQASDLGEAFKVMGPQSEVNALQIFREIISGLYSIHQAGFYYGDLHPSNILVTSNGHVSLCFPGPNKKNFENQVRFLEYLDPSILEGNEPTKSCDFYSLGVILFYVLAGYVPFFGNNREEIHTAASTRSPIFPSNISENMRNLVLTCMKPEATMESVLASELMQGVKWDDVAAACAKKGPIPVPKPFEGDTKLDNSVVTDDTMIVSFNAESCLMKTE